MVWPSGRAFITTHGRYKYPLGRERGAASQNAFRHFSVPDTFVFPWEFAVEIDQFRQLGLCDNDLRYLVRMQYVDHAADITSLGSDGRQFRSTGDLCFTDQTCFVLTPSGLAMAMEAGLELDAPPSVIRIASTSDESAHLAKNTPFPSWDAERHILSFDGQVVKHFKWAGANQETILSVFEEEAWPARIDDPLVPAPTIDAKRRLSDTIKCLNRGHKIQLLRFHGDGTGQGVIWRAVDPDLEPEG
jgi:hypothetical protein